MDHRCKATPFPSEQPKGTPFCRGYQWPQPEMIIKCKSRHGLLQRPGRPLDRTWSDNCRPRASTYRQLAYRRKQIACCLQGLCLAHCESPFNQSDTSDRMWLYPIQVSDLVSTKSPAELCQDPQGDTRDKWGRSWYKHQTSRNNSKKMYASK